jgi:formate--tetrahydrofolate ligase
MLDDILIAQNANLKDIREIAKSLDLNEADLELYGNHKAKLKSSIWDRLKEKEDGHLILVTAINPTPAGEGKTTTTIGLGQAMAHIGEKSIVALREPSLGPVMGVKGGAAGGGFAQVVPMEDINLHFTGDIHAVTTATNLLAALIDNHLHHENLLGIDPRQIIWKRALDMNDRSLRQMVVGLGGKSNGPVREEGFQISVASEVMAILCLSENITDLKNRLGEIIFGYTYDGVPLRAKDLNCQGALASLLKDAIKPNLVQTLENTPVLIHGGPFANIAHGCNSLIATRTGLKLADYCITEAGFGADLGAEKFFDIKCRTGNLKPSVSVLVCTIRALKYNGGVKKEYWSKENISALRDGLKNLEKHIENIRKFNVPVIVSLNKFETDTPNELSYVKEFCQSLNVSFSICECYAKGGSGGIDLAQKVLELANEKSNPGFSPLYSLDLSIREKIEKIAKEIYGAKSIHFTPAATKQLDKLESIGLNSLPVCMAKTQYSLSDNPKRLGRPENFEITIRELRPSAGAGFIVAITGEIMTMPGLPRVPSSQKIDIDEKGILSGLF